MALLDADKHPAEDLTRRRLFTALGGGALAAAGGGYEWIERRDRLEEDLQAAILSYLTDQRKNKFTHPEFLQQLTRTDARFEGNDPRLGRVYFSTHRGGSAEAIAALVKHPERSVRAKTSGPYAMLDSAYAIGRDLFGFPFEEFRIRPDARITIPFGAIAYDATAKELADYINNASVYGGPKRVKTWLIDPRTATMPNLGAYVAVRGEPSLERLVHRITKNGSAIARLARRIKHDESRKAGDAQALLDFVSNNIVYNEQDADEEAGLSKRPDEVLMTRKGVCASQVTLLSSLYEQAGIDHLLLMFWGGLLDRPHTSIGVNAGHKVENGLRFGIEGRTYTIAETTAPGFVIGETRFKAPILTAENLRLYQRPGKGSKAIEYRTGLAVQFVE